MVPLEPPDRERTCIRKDRDDGRACWIAGLSAHSVSDIPGSTVDGFISHEVSDVTVLLGGRIIVEKERIVGVLFRIPVVEVREGGVVPLEKLVRNAELWADVRREIMSGQRHFSREVRWCVGDLGVTETL